MTVDHRYTQVIVEFVRGHVGGKKSFQLTYEQEALKIPRHVAYLAALSVVVHHDVNVDNHCDVVVDDTDRPRAPHLPSFTLDQQANFKELQRQYLALVCDCGVDDKKEEEREKQPKNNKTSSFIFQLSPRLCPTPGQLSTVKNDFITIMNRLEDMAQKSMKELFLLNENDETADSRRKNERTKITRRLQRQQKKKLQDSMHPSQNKKDDGDDDDDESNGNENNDIRGDDDEDGHHDDSFMAMSRPRTRTRSHNMVAVGTTGTTFSLDELDQDDKNVEDSTGSSPSSWIEVKRRDNTSSKSDTATGIRGQNQINIDKPSSMKPQTYINEISYVPCKEKAKSEDDHHQVSRFNHVITSSDDSSSKDRIGDTTTNVLPSSNVVDCEIGDNSNKIEPPSIKCKKVTVHNESPVHNEVVAVVQDNKLSKSETRYLLPDNSQQRLHDGVMTLQNQLQEERAAHIKERKRLKQQHDDLVQGLQLRLYISETKLRTYQEALENHCLAVSNNIVDATTTSTMMSTTHSTNDFSPSRRRRPSPPESTLVTTYISTNNRS
jgi:hypothetical protein